MKTKIASIALVLLLLVVGLVLIGGVVQDRQNYRRLSVQGVANSLAGQQTLIGPLIHMACTEEWAGAVDGNDPDVNRRQFSTLAAPVSLVVNGGTQLEARGRGLHETQVFKLKTQVTAKWGSLDSLTPVRRYPGSRMTCAQPVMMMAVSDARGIRHASLKLAGQELLLKPGTLFDNFPRGVHTLLSTEHVKNPALEAAFDLELVGTGQLAVVPLGGDTQVKLTSNWPHPSFGGQFLPVERTITGQGFDASWRVSALASTAQQDVLKRKSICAPGDDGTQESAACLEALGVTFVDPGDTYALSDRATKYGLLFIGLTFLAVGLFEFMKSLRVHPVQYLLVGAAMSMFFLLLVSLSEHMAFGAAYALAAAACVSLLTYYAVYMLHSWSRGLPFGLGIGVLYGMLYVLLQMEQAALVVGAVALFTVLAAVMMLTRRIDWYARMSALGAPAAVTPPASPVSPAPAAGKDA
ncbi:MAG: cell envelope integrity protein CreD [Comamonadaceae bacterium]|nr:MAG: cell envelope integrity protein CreD [Comamonadaceae bacterium]